MNGNDITFPRGEITHVSGDAADPRGPRPPRPLPLFWPAFVPRNLLFLAVILFHGFRRLLPPH